MRYWYSQSTHLPFNIVSLHLQKKYHFLEILIKEVPTLKIILMKKILQAKKEQKLNG